MARRPASVGSEGSALRDQAAAYGEVSPMPLAGVSGEKGPRIVRSQATSPGVDHRAPASIATCHGPFDDIHRGPSIRGLGQA